MEVAASKENQVISVVVDPDDWRRFGVKALKAGASKSSIVRRLVRDYVAGRIVLGPEAGPAKSIRRGDADITDI